MPDVHLIFDEKSDVVKVPAHKAVLAASSSVFDAMFNGELKEQGDVRIVDASPAAFKEFLQLFYGYRVKLKMDNIAEVLKMIDKYDVAKCFPICADFLKDHLTIDDILWGLNLAIMYRLDKLKVFCTIEIKKNFKKIWDSFEMRNDIQPVLSPNLNGRFLSQADTGRVFQHVFFISKQMVFDQFEMDRWREGRYSFMLVHNSLRRENMSNREVIQFKLTGSMLLTCVFCTKLYYYFSN